MELQQVMPQHFTIQETHYVPVPGLYRKVRVPTSIAPAGMCSSISHWPHPTQ